MNETSGIEINENTNVWFWLRGGPGPSLQAKKNNIKNKEWKNGLFEIVSQLIFPEETMLVKITETGGGKNTKKNFLH